MSEEQRSHLPASTVDPDQGELFPQQLLQQMIAVERERIDSANRRIDVARMAVEANDAADKRQYDYHMARLNSANKANEQTHRLGAHIVYYGGGFAILVIAFLLGMAFFGSPPQAANAIAALKIVGIGLGGYGIVATITRIIRRLFQRGET